MTAGELLARLRASGLSMQADGARLIVIPGSRLTEEDRREIRENKDEILALLLDPDPRVTCTACANYIPPKHRCANHGAALLWSADIAPALAALPQHCPAHRSNL